LVDIYLGFAAARRRRVQVERTRISTWSRWLGDSGVETIEILLKECVEMGGILAGMVRSWNRCRISGHHAGAGLALGGAGPVEALRVS